MIEMKIKHEILIKQLEETVFLYNEIMSSINENCVYNYSMVDLINFYNNLSAECEEQIRLIKNASELNKNKIYELCDHDFITDIIDIDPEKTKTICYCTICELSKRE